jgi:hypothetical protein
VAELHADPLRSVPWARDGNMTVAVFDLAQAGAASELFRVEHVVAPGASCEALAINRVRTRSHSLAPSLLRQRSDCLPVVATSP